MNRYHFGEHSFSDVAIPATVTAPEAIDSYHFKHKSYPNIYIPNRALAMNLSFRPEDSDEIKALREAVEEYNEYLTKLEAIPGFVDYFKQHGFCISRKEITDQWSEEIADLVFSKKSYCFDTELRVIHNCLFDSSIPMKYWATVENCSVSIPIGKLDIDYPAVINGKKAIWNWMDNGHDFCLYLWMLLGERASQSDESSVESMEDDNAVHYHFGAYDLYRDADVEPQLVNIFKKLESLGYIESYTIKPEHEDPKWFDYGKIDGSIDLALVDMSFKKNKLLMEQIELLLWQPSDDVKEGQCFLTDKNGKQYISDHRGALGGHCGLKIYGRLDCPSANRYVAKGEYVQHRVFFEDEKTAIAAGYRPCAKCMPEAYKIWKASKVKENNKG